MIFLLLFLWCHFNSKRSEIFKGKSKQNKEDRERWSGRLIILYGRFMGFVRKVNFWTMSWVKTNARVDFNLDCQEKIALQDKWHIYLFSEFDVYQKAQEKKSHTFGQLLWFLWPYHLHLWDLLSFSLFIFCKKRCL